VVKSKRLWCFPQHKTWVSHHVWTCMDMLGRCGERFVLVHTLSQHTESNWFNKFSEMSSLDLQLQWFIIF
jgi:hypothetical protein